MDYLIEHLYELEKAGVRPKGYAQDVIDHAALVREIRGQKVAVLFPSAVEKLMEKYSEYQELRFGNMVESAAQRLVGVKSKGCGKCNKRKKKWNKYGVRWKRGQALKTLEIIKPDG